MKMNGRDTESTAGSNTGKEDDVSGYGALPETYFVPPPQPAEDPTSTVKEGATDPPLPLPPRMPPNAEEEKGPAKW